MNARIFLGAALLLTAACYRPQTAQSPVQPFNESIAKVTGRTWVIEPPSTTSITLAYQDGHFIGSAGCNRYAATTQPRDNGGGISIAPTLSTRRACVPAVMDYEHQFLNRLGAVTSMRVTDHEVYLTYQRGPDFGTLEFIPYYPKFGLQY